MPLHLILGGARSGKSRHAEQLALASGAAVTLIATARAGDAEMAQRIAYHQSTRPIGWTTIEAPTDLASALLDAASPGAVVVVDCLTLWLTNLLFDPPGIEPVDGLVNPPERYLDQRAALLEVLPEVPAQIICVSNEIGFGVVPMGAQTRFFVDEMGRLNQAVAALASQVTLTVAGLPLALKG